MAVTQRELNAMKCSTPGCECHGQVLKPGCHPSAGFDAEYHHGVLHLNCKACGDQVAAIAVQEARADA